MKNVIVRLLNMVLRSRVYAINRLSWVVLIMRLINLTGSCMGWYQSSMIFPPRILIWIRCPLLQRFYPWHSPNGLFTKSMDPGSSPSSTNFASHNHRFGNNHGGGTNTRPSVGGSGQGRRNPNSSHSERGS
ncbi:hypothetical protein ACS0TY_003992 [Phlomoides rotata]